MNFIKCILLGLLATLIILCACFLFNNNNCHDASIFIAQSIVDNAIFCLMFIVVVLITGIKC